jgi:hypothetical protein
MKILKTITVIICYKTVAYRKHLRYPQFSIKTNSHHELHHNGVLKVVFYTTIFHNWVGINFLLKNLEKDTILK